jgi:hypothetical protein
MRQKNLTRFLLAAAVLLAAAPALSQTFPLDIELGYRFVNVAGSDEMYRSQINEREGFLLRSLTLATSDFNGGTTLFDKFRLDASDVGAGPLSAARLQMAKSGIYDLRFSYSRWQLFSALPAFANPLLSQGIVPGQHTYETQRYVYDAELQILPGGIFTPIFGYTYNVVSGPAATTISLGGDEFRLSQNFKTYDEEPRVGFNFLAGPANVYFMQGWRKSHSTESAQLAAGAGSGNNTAPILGQSITSTSYSRTSTTDVNIPVTTASAVFQLGCFGRILGSYVRANGASDTQGDEAATGNYVNFAAARFFGGLSETVQSNANAENWRGAARAELTLLPGLELSGGWAERSHEQTGFELLSTLLTNTYNYVGTPTTDIQTILNINNGYKRTDETGDVGLIYRQAGPFGLRASVARTQEKVDLSEDVAEIIAPSGQSGSYSRTVSTYNLGMTFKLGGLVVDADYRGENANQAIVRTDFDLRNTWKARLTWNFQKFLRISGTGMWSWQTNTQTGINSTGKFQQYGGDIDISPVSALSLRFSGNAYKADTYIPILAPPGLEPLTSTWIEDGYSLEGGLSLNLKPLTLQASGGEFKNSGSMNFKIDRVRGTIEVPVVKAFSFIAEWAYDKYTETIYTYGDYSASRVGLFVHWKGY